MSRTASWTGRGAGDRVRGRAAARWNWRMAARCRTTDAEGLFVTGAQQREARRFCRTCPVRTECLAHALDQRVEFGVWGGMTERERRALLRRRPDVDSWAGLLADARDAHYAGPAAADDQVGDGADDGADDEERADDGRLREPA